MVSFGRYFIWFLLCSKSEETYVLTKQEILLGKGTWVESSRVRKPGELLCRVAHSVQAESPLDLSRTLPVGGGLLVPYFLSGSPVIKQLMQMVTMVPGQGGAVSISVLPLTIPPARWGI